MTLPQRSLQVVRYSEASCFSMLEPYWNSLLRTSPVNDPFLSWEWQSTWWKNYGEGVPLWMLVVWEDEKPVGIMPLMQASYCKHGLKARGLCTIGRNDIDFCGLIAKATRPDVAAAMGTFLAKCRLQWDILRLNNCRSGGQNLEPFFHCFKPGRHIISKTEEIQHLYIPLQGGWEECQTRLPSKLKRKVRSKFNSLKFDHSFSFVHLSGAEITEDHLQDFFSISLQGRYPHLYQTSQDRQFHRDLVKNGLSDKPEHALH